jgi:hypothetical protein
LPNELRELVDKAFGPPSSWDNLDARQRRQLAAQYDTQHDPSYEPSLYFGLTVLHERLQNLEKEARDRSEYAAVDAFREIADRVKAILEIDRGRVGADIQELRRLAEERQGTHSENTLHSYSTPLLEIQKDAIAEFFVPRRDKDPKKEEVIQWIMDRMHVAGLPESKNIAAALFTMIKPLDHNPRKRRG